MIVRISTEGQYDVAGADTEQLNELDNRAVDACEASDEASFREVFGRLLEFVRDHGTPVPDDELVGSDIILPPPDVSLEEARTEFQGDGLIPGGVAGKLPSAALHSTTCSRRATVSQL